MMQKAQAMSLDRPKLPEAHEIKSFKDVVSLYQTNTELLPPPAGEGGNPPPAFYRFQKSHPGYNPHTLKKFEEEASQIWHEPEAEEDAVPLY